MKKTAISLILVLAMVLAMVLVPVPVAEAAGTNHVAHTEGMDHCACGGTAKGIGDHTTCTSLTGAWVDLNAYVQANAGESGASLATGNYYLSDNLDLTNYNALLFDQADSVVTICLNGFKLFNTQTGTDNKSRAIYAKKDAAAGTLNICDCAGGGEITSKSEGQGAVIRVENSSSFKGTIKLFSGTITGSTVKEAGGAMRITRGVCNIYNAVIKDGKNVATSNCWAGNLMVSNVGVVNMYGGVIKDGVITNTSGAAGANVRVANAGSQFNLFGGAILGGSVSRADENEALVATDISLSVQTGGSAPKTSTLSGGFVQLPEGGLALNNNLKIDATSDLFVDLNGNKLTGEATVKAGDKKLSIVDTTAAKGEAGTGLVSSPVTIEGTLAQGKALPACAGENAGQRYVALTNMAGSVVAHRIYVGFDKIQLYKDDNGNIGMNYVTNIVMDDEVKALLVDKEMKPGKVYAAGCNFGVTDLSNAETVGLAKDAYKADIATNINAILDGNGDDAAIGMKICASAYVNLNIDGQTVTITSNTYEYSLQDVVNALNGIADLATQNPAAAELLADIKSRVN